MKVMWVLVLVGLSSGWAQEDSGKQACLRFLSKGEYAPRPALTSLEDAASQPGSGDPAQGELTELCVPATGPTRFTVAHDAEGAVVSYNAFDRALRLDPAVFADPARTRAALQARQRYSATELRRRARVFFKSRIPGKLERRWTRVESRLCCEQNPVWFQVRYLEYPPAGVLAVYPNQIVVGLNPETGEVVFYRASHVAAKLSEPPPVDAEAAAVAAEALVEGGRFDDAALGLSWGEAKPRPLWTLVGWTATRYVVVQVDGISGEARLLRDSPKE